MPAVKCPSCGAAVEWQGNPHRPFCSERCRLIDLGGWLGERYAIPGEALPPDPESGGAPEPSGAASRKGRS